MEHVVLALSDIDDAFVRRVDNPAVRYVALRRPSGPTAAVLPRIWQLLRRLSPTILHTRNLSTLELQVAGWAARIPVRIHGEHGWDMEDLHRSNAKALWTRRAIAPFVHRFVALSAPTETYLRQRVLVPGARITNIPNGVDTSRFHPAQDLDQEKRLILPGGVERRFVIGVVGRLAPVKNIPLLLKAVARARSVNPEFARDAFVAVIGDGPVRDELTAIAEWLGLKDAVWFSGARDDIPECVRCIDVLCQPSLAEGISNVILEAMASGVPVIATDVGGNSELVSDGRTGVLVTSEDERALADALICYHSDPDLRRVHGRAGLESARGRFSLSGMVDAYTGMYADELNRARPGRPGASGLGVHR